MKETVYIIDAINEMIISRQIASCCFAFGEEGKTLDS